MAKKTGKYGTNSRILICFSVLIMLFSLGNCLTAIPSDCKTFIEIVSGGYEEPSRWEVYVNQ